MDLNDCFFFLFFSKTVNSVMIENKIDSDRQDKKAEHDGSLFRSVFFFFQKHSIKFCPILSVSKSERKMNDKVPL